MTWKPIAIGLLLAGCPATIGGGNGGGGVDSGNGSSIDSGGSSGGNDSSVSQNDAATNAACPNDRKIFLEFNGVTLQQAATSNAATNQASWLNNGTSQVPMWRSGSGTRAADIASVVAGVKTRLGTSPVEVVTTKPLAGSYVMIVFGGQSTGNGGTVGTIYGGGTNDHDCGDAVKNDVGWVADGFNLSFTADLGVGAIGWGLGLNGTNDPNGCMCNWANNCQSATGACALSASIASTTSASPATTCPNQNPQNEIAAFSTKFCQ
ncbi:MAG TPA: hypothetical protein VIV11_21245 [Kofleriaceae bacterium]